MPPLADARSEPTRRLRAVGRPLLSVVAWLVAGLTAQAQSLPPSEVLMPGSQPPEVVSGLGLTQPPLVPLLSGTSGAAPCSLCHVDFSDGATAIHDTWSGSMMAHASRDPLMWAALAVAEQDFAGIGDTCVRCHVSKGWIEGRSLPSNGSALLAEDAEGVSCHLCHRLARPDGSEPGIVGAQAPSFAAAGYACATGDANAGMACVPGSGAPCAGGGGACERESFHGNAQIALFQDAPASSDVSRLGPYDDALAPHAVLASDFQRDAALCGTCHDVSNPVTGDLAPAHGRQSGPLASGLFHGSAGGPASAKAAVRNPPYAYGVEQRTYSEWVASDFATTLVSDFDSLPIELRGAGGAPALVRAATLAQGGDYADGTARGFTCQSCHMRPANTHGCSFANQRSDMPVHDFTGANVWAPRAILWLDDATLHGASRLRLGGGIPLAQRAATERAIERAVDSLESAAVLEPSGPVDALPDSVRVVNRSGHKLFTGYPEGRRMWLRITWHRGCCEVLRVDGAYGPIEVDADLDGDGDQPDVVETLLAPDDPNTHVWQVESGISKAWATQLIDGLDADPETPLAYDRETGAVAATLADAAAPESSGTQSFHLAWNDVVLRDDRIPPWRMDWSEARKRNALPVPETLHLPSGQSPGPGATYIHYEDVALDAPPGATRAEIELLYQTASWEYVQFLWKANAGGDPFLAGTGRDLLDAWLATGGSQPTQIAYLEIPEPERLAAAVAAVLALAARVVYVARPSRRGRGGRVA